MPLKSFQDFNQNGFHKWPFLTVQVCSYFLSLKMPLKMPIQTWGEDPRGIWTLMVESLSTNPNIGGVHLQATTKCQHFPPISGIFSDWTLLLYGTEDPAQPSDQRYSPYAPSTFRRPGIGQQLSSQVGHGNGRRISGGTHGAGGGGVAGGAARPWWQAPRPQPPPPPPTQFQASNQPQQWNNANNNNQNAAGGGAQFSSNSIFGNIIRQLSRLVNNRRQRAVQGRA
jgi:hypothetical protein